MDLNASPSLTFSSTKTGQLHQHNRLQVIKMYTQHAKKYIYSS